MTEDTRTFTITLPMSVYEEITKMAKSECRSKSSQILYLLKFALQELNDDLLLIRSQTNQ